MKSIQVELPEKLAQELDAMVREDRFRNEAEAVRLALVEFVHRHHRSPPERFNVEV